MRQNEAVTFQRDDARAFAQGMRILINANTHNGKVNQTQLIKDIHFFCIDQKSSTLSHFLGYAKENNAAYNLLSGPRLGTIGWKEKYWEKGQQYKTDKAGKVKLINQAHHFAFFFAETLKSKNNLLELSKIWYGAKLIDMGNKQDVDLARTSAQIAVDIQLVKILWEDVPSTIYEALKE